MSRGISARRFCFVVSGTLLLALLVREWFVLTAVFPNPAQGDVSSYLRYALHLVWDGTFSQAGTGQPVKPDMFRGPAYPIFLAALYVIAGPKLWFAAIYQAQVFLGVATVFNTIAVARMLLGRVAAVAAGIWLALEPHNIAQNGTILTETLLGFVVSSGVLCTLLALNRRSLRWAPVSGFFFALSCLVNPVVVLFPPLLLYAYWREKLLRAGFLMLIVPVIAMTAWDVRGLLLHLNPNEVAERTLAFGSWPELYASWKNQMVDQNAHETYQRILESVDEMVKTPAAGMHSIADRIAENPLRYAAWYFLEKPYLLWAWDVQLGAGGENVLDTLNSPLERNPVLRGLVLLMKYTNPLTFFLATAGALMWLRNRRAFPIAVLFFYVTAIYSLFQSEPRYSTPFRFIEIVLALSIIFYLGERLKSARPTHANGLETK